MPPYHPDYEPAQEESDDGYHDNDDGDDDGERFAQYEQARVRRGSQGYEVRAIDREQLLAEYIASRGQEAGYYRRYEPEPPSEPESEGGRDDEVDEVDDDDDDGDNDNDEEPLAVRVEKWRSGEAIS